MIINELTLTNTEVLTRTLSTECPVCDCTDITVNPIGYIALMKKRYGYNITVTTDDSIFYVRSFSEEVFGDVYHLASTNNFRAIADFNIIVPLGSRAKVTEFVDIFKSLDDGQKDCHIDIVKYDRIQSIRDIHRRWGIRFTVQLTPANHLNSYSLPLIEFATAYEVIRNDKIASLNWG